MRNDRPHQAAPHVFYRPRNAAQEMAGRLWSHCRWLALTGPAGTGKTACAVGLALADLAAGRASRVVLARPALALDADDELGYLKGELGEKLSPWLEPFADAASGFHLGRLLDTPGLAAVAVAHLRGRTVGDGQVLVVDEAQNLTARKLSCVLTRRGGTGKVVLCGDPAQSDLPRPPLPEALDALEGFRGFRHVRFPPEDNLRDPDMAELQARLRAAGLPA